MTAPIIGATKPGHIDAAVAATTLELTDEEVERLEQPYRPKWPVGVKSTAPSFGQVTLKNLTQTVTNQSHDWCNQVPRSRGVGRCR